jgi:sugar (pentulose or hexulose) kinase
MKIITLISHSFTFKIITLEGTGLLDLETRQWDKKAVGSVDESLLQVLPPLIQPHEAAGRRIHI